jgi:hypothetical protein
MWNFELYHVFATEHQREAEREAARARLARTAEEGRLAARSGGSGAGLGEAAPWWAVLRALRRRARLAD